MLLFVASCSGLQSNKKSPDEKKADIFYAHGTRALVEKDYTTALDRLIQANRLRPDDSKILNNLGMAYYFKGDWGRAKSSILEAIDVDENNADAINNLASIKFQERNFQEAEKLYRKVLTILTYPHQYRTRYNLALIEIKRGNQGNAHQELDFSIKEREDYCPALYQKALLYKNTYQLKKAEEGFQKAISGLCNDQPAGHYQLAGVWTQLKKYPLAYEKYHEIQEKFPKSRFANLSNLRVRRLEKANVLAEKDVLKQKYQALKDGREKVQGPKF